MSGHDGVDIRSWLNAQGLAGQFKYMFRRQGALEPGPCVHYLQGCLLPIKCRAKQSQRALWRGTKLAFIEPLSYITPRVLYLNSVHFTVLSNAA
jgi:hypothetical protein